MADFFNNLTSIRWWIGVVIVTVILNLAAMYLKSPFDRLFSSISTTYRTRSKAKKAEREKQIRNLVGNEHEQILFASRINFTLGKIIFWVVIGAGAIILSGILVIVTNQWPTTPHIWGFRIMALGLEAIGFLIIIRGIFSLLFELPDDQKILKEAKIRGSKVEGSN